MAAAGGSARKRRGDESEQVSAWIAQAGQLSTRARAAQKDHALALKTMKVEMEREVAEVEEAERKTASARQEEASVLFGQLQQVKHNVSALHSMIQTRGTGQDYVNRLRETMDAVEDEVFLARQQQQEQFEKLVYQEQVINSELGDMEEMLASWMRGDARPATAAAGGRDGEGVVSKVGQMLQNPQLPPEVLAVERLLAEEGGVTGGWDMRDHDRFLRYRTQFKGQRQVYCEKTAHDLVDHDIASVQGHDRWFDRYQALLQRKREAIRSWRTSRATPGAPSDDAPDSELLDLESEGAGRQRPVSAPLGGRRLQAARGEEKQRLREWREEKEAKEAEKADEEERVKQEAAARRTQKEVRSRAEGKARIGNYKESKKAEEDARKRRVEEDKEEAKPRVTVDQLDRIRQRNRRLTEEHTVLIRRKTDQERAQAERVQALLEAATAPSVPRDPSRLTAPTAASVAKREAALKAMGEEETRGYFAIMRPVGGQVLHHATRATPSWRAGM